MHIHCDVIRDLLPLYVDGLTSKASNDVIKHHIETCTHCLEHLQSLQSDLKAAEPSLPTPQEQAETNAIRRIRRKIYLSKVALLALGGIFGAYATGKSPFQAPLLVYPLVGIAGELLLGSVVITPLVVFGASVIGMFFFEEFHYGFIFMSAIYTVFTVMGALLSYSVRKVLDK